ncbi:alpha/beta fold hydrolase [Flavimaribacter sediminis]|nr:alpha/beta hydrolase [Flavimaribacter sediminis]
MSGQAVDMPRPVERVRKFTGSHQNCLVATTFGAGGPPVVFLHGGGQTRHAWQATARTVARAGWTAISVDLRGHGDSDWIDGAHYNFDDFAKDALRLFQTIGKEYGEKPVAVGASLGGISSLIAQDLSGQDLLAGLVLVDVTPRMRRDGVEKILGFMGARAHEGFTSLEEAADTISAYLPNRNRPKSLSGLSKNLRRGEDGRYRWHWDPAFISGPHPIEPGQFTTEEKRVEAARALTIPTLLVRGRQSELVQDEHTEEFLEIAPHARLADVSGAGHMVAGDRNDLFQAAILDFLGDLRQGEATS